MALDLDEDTTAVITTIFFNMLIALSILIGWLIFRQCRGDKQNVHRHMSEASEIVFDEHEYTPLEEHAGSIDS